MGFVADIIAVKRRLRQGVSHLDVKILRDVRSAPITATHVGPPGDDSFPLITDRSVNVPLQQTGRVAAVAYFDTLNPGKALLGEKRFYARTAAGAIIAEVWMKNTGAVEVTNAAGSIKLGADGAVDAVTPAGSFGMNAVGVLSASVTSLSISNAAGSMSLDTAGVWTINGVTIDPAGNVMATNFIAGAVTLLTHLHAAGLLLDSVPAPVTGTTAVAS